MANQFINAMTDLWNSGGTAYSAIKMNITNAASAGDGSTTDQTLMSKLIHMQIGSVDKFTVDKLGNIRTAGTIYGAGVVSSGASSPSGNDTAALGSSSTAWSDLFLASGGVINWLAGDVTITHAADSLLFAGAATGYKFDAVVRPTANDGAALGNVTASWADLYLAIGAVINYGNGNAILTHSDLALTVGPGDLRVTTAGSTAASVVTVGGTQTLTGKTLTSPTINNATSISPTISGAPTAGGATWTNLGTVTTCAINGGTINGTTIGSTTAAAITGTTVSGASAAFSTIVGSTSVTAPTGTFSTSVFGGKVQAAQVFESTGTNIILSPAAGLNTIIFRPRGQADATGQVTIDNAGSIVTPGGLSAGSITADGGIIGGTVIAAKGVATNPSNVHMWLYGPNNEDRCVIYTSSPTAGDVVFRVNGTQSYTFATDGQFYGPNNLYAAGARYQTDGNIVGSVWRNFAGAVYGDAYTAIANQIEQRASAWRDNAVNTAAANTPTSIANSVTATTLGACGFFNRIGNTGAFGADAAIGGGNLGWSNVATSVNNAPNVGAWRCLGFVSSGSTTTGSTTLWMRYA